KTGDVSTFNYMPGDAHSASAHRLTAIGCLSRMFLGTPVDTVRPSVEALIQRGGVPTAEKTDLYYWYYASLCAFQCRGATWTNWSDAMQKTLTASLERDGANAGSWAPTGEFADEW